MNKKIILLSVLGVILAGCIGTVSAEWFDFSPSTGEISGKILESEIKWNTEQVLYTNSSVLMALIGQKITHIHMLKENLNQLYIVIVLSKLN